VINLDKIVSDLSNANLFDCGGPALTDDDTLTVYTRVGNCRKVPVPHKAEFEEL
jgi:hypothetical protein